MSAVPLMSLNARRTDNIRDSDQLTDEDEDPLESVLNRMKYRAQMSRARNSWTGLSATGMLCFVIGFSLGYTTFLMLDKSKHLFAYNDGDPRVVSAIVNEISAEKIAGFMRTLNNNYYNNMSDNLKQAQLLQQHFIEENMDSISPTFPAHILLSYFQDDQNYIAVLYGNGDMLYRTSHLNFGVPLDISTFEVSNTAVGDLTYIDFGRDSDFYYLETKSIAVKDNIVLARLGKVLPVDLVDAALKRGAKGVILIADDGYKNISGSSKDYAYRFFLLPSQLGMLQVMHGNPSLQLNPGADNKMGCVPVQIITATDADDMLREYFDNKSATWRTNLSTFYSSSVDYTSRQLQMNVHIANTKKTFHNVIATMKGSHEPDRYILLGNNRESLLPHAVDPFAGTAVMMELVRVLGKLRRKQGWRPRRTLVFCSWGISQGDQHLTSAPLPEEWGHLVESRALGYIDVDASVSSINFSAQATPLLIQVLFESAALVPNPQHVNKPTDTSTLYDTWYSATQEKPVVNILQGCGDLRTIIHNHGIPSLSFHFSNPEMDPKLSIPKNSKHENRTYHRALTQLWGVLAWKMSESVIVPLDVMQYSALLNHSVTAIGSKYQQTILTHTIPLGAWK